MVNGEERIVMEKEIIVTAALVGSRPTKKMNPAVPYSPKEITTSALECYKAGAAIAHIHVRNPITGENELNIDYFKEILARIREECDMIVNLTTSASFLQGPDVGKRRLGPVFLKPDMCSFDLGSVNFSDRVFLNPPDWAEEAAKCMMENDVKPEIEVFDTGHISQAIDLIQKGLITSPPYFQVCMGVKWGIEASAENLLFMKSKLPPDAVWSVLGVGKAQLPMITLAMILGGNVRVGFEDNIYLKQGVLASSNAQMVEMAVDLAERLGRRVATPQEVRGILKIKSRSV
jgi:3-keto-5-aminohexanoate cleavage enzyme